jgi:hypothetical protein
MRAATRGEYKMAVCAVLAMCILYNPVLTVATMEEAGDTGAVLLEPLHRCMPVCDCTPQTSRGLRSNVRVAVNFLRFWMENSTASMCGSFLRVFALAVSLLMRTAPGLPPSVVVRPLFAAADGDVCRRDGVDVVFVRRGWMQSMVPELVKLEMAVLHQLDEDAASEEDEEDKEEHDEAEEEDDEDAGLPIGLDAHVAGYGTAVVSRSKPSLWCERQCVRHRRRHRRCC